MKTQLFRRQALQNIGSSDDLELPLLLLHRNVTYLATSLALPLLFTAWWLVFGHIRVTTETPGVLVLSRYLVPVDRPSNALASGKLARGSYISTAALRQMSAELSFVRRGRDARRVQLQHVGQAASRASTLCSAVRSSASQSCPIVGRLLKPLAADRSTAGEDIHELRQSGPIDTLGLRHHVPALNSTIRGRESIDYINAYDGWRIEDVSRSGVDSPATALKQFSVLGFDTRALLFIRVLDGAASPLLARQQLRLSFPALGARGASEAIAHLEAQSLDKFATLNATVMDQFSPGVKVHLDSIPTELFIAPLSTDWENESMTILLPCNLVVTLPAERPMDVLFGRFNKKYRSALRSLRQWRMPTSR